MLDSIRREGTTYELAVDGEPGRTTGRLAWPVSSTEVRTIVTVSVSKDGRITTDGAPARGQWVVIHADADAAYGRVVDATRAAEDAGGVVVFTVSPLPARAPPRAQLVTHAWKDCPFPPESDTAKIDSAAVIVRATVDSSGRATEVRVLLDPGSGFGAAARACALRATYEPARDADGRAVGGETAPFRVRFER